MTKTKKSLTKRKLAGTIIIAVATMFLCTPVLVGQAYPGYHKYNDMTRELMSLVDANKNIAKLESIGKSLEGRDIWLVTVANKTGTPVSERPGMFIGGNFEGDHLIGSELSLSMIKYLLGKYDSDENVKASIDNHVYYIFPRINPDGAEKNFENIKTGSKTNMFQYDGDNDGRMDEDGPDDLNGDGFITLMRVKDEHGMHMIDENDPRMLKKADPTKGESGEYSVYWEGIDNDNDGFINEDPPGGVDINRNFAHKYPYYQDDSGWHMVSEKESIALMDWILEHRNIAIMLSFGESDNLIVAPNAKGKLSTGSGINMHAMANDSYKGASKVGMISTARSRSFYGMYGMGRGSQGAQEVTGFKPARKVVADINSSDLVYFTKVARKYKELTDIHEQPPLRNPEGSFFEYGYYQFGALSFSTPGWGLDSEESEEEKKKSAGADKKLLDYFNNENIDGFVNWQNYTHPELGDVEIGGFIPFNVNNPPASKINKLGKSHAEFAIWLSGLYADINIVKTEVINHGGGLFRIKAEVENSGFLPTSLSHGVTSRSVSPTMVQLDINPEALVSGNSKTNFFQSLDGSGQREKYEWLLKGKAGDEIELKARSQKAGSDSKVITLK